LSRFETSLRDVDLELRQRVAAVAWIIGVVLALILVFVNRSQVQVEGVGFGFPPADPAASAISAKAPARPDSHPVHASVLAEHVREVVADAQEATALSLTVP
jgi:hypothetical protein